MIDRRFAICVMAALAACGGKKGDDGGTANKAVVGDPGDKTGDGPPKRAALTLHKLETVDGVLDAPAGKQPTYSFKTPPFKFVGMVPVDVDLKAKKITLQVQFTGPVLPNIAYGKMGWTLDGQAVKGLRMEPFSSPSHGGGYERIVVSLTDPGIAAGKKIELKLADVNA